MIKKLSQKTSEIIKSQQYINNTYTITKELLENSLDSSATLIKIIIDEDSIRVDDNGSGIEILTDIGNEGVTSKHSTTYFVLGLNEDSTNLYCGYRGLALCSIKNMCDLEIISKHENNETAFKKDLSTGNIIPCARQSGTTVNVTNIFYDCPIRKKLNTKNISKYLKLISLLVEAYALVYPTNFIVKYKGNTLVNQKGHSSLQDFCRINYKSIYDDCLEKESKYYYLFMLPLPKSKDESRIFYGKRHVTSKKILKEIKQVYNLYKEGIPVFYLELKGIIDFNISPDKSEILFENEDEIIGFIQEDIKDYFSMKMYGENNLKRNMDDTLSFFKEKYPGTENINNSGVDISEIKYKEVINKTNSNNKISGGVIKLQKSSKIFPESFKNDDMNQKPYQNMNQHEIERRKPFIEVKRNDIITSSEIDINQTDLNTPIVQIDITQTSTTKKSKNNSQSSDAKIFEKESQIIQNDLNEFQTSNAKIFEKESQNTQTAIDEFILEPLQRQHEPSDSFIQITDKELETTVDDQHTKNYLKRELLTPVSSNFLDIKDRDFYNTKKSCIHNLLDKDEFVVEETKVDLSDNIIENERDEKNIKSSISENSNSLVLEDTIFDYIKNNEQGEIKMTIQKSDFNDMEIIGQFNKGFILAKLIKDSKILLIIIDQHASDEIYNYENIKNNTRIARQKLVVPLKLSLTPLDKIFVEEHHSIFSKYGFDIDDDFLLTMPVFKGHEFNFQDFQVLLENVKNGEYGCDKIHRIMASKACRTSIMIGDPLTKSRMEKIVRNLSTLEKPWQCPHGRPTFMIIEEIPL